MAESKKTAKDMMTADSDPVLLLDSDVDVLAWQFLDSPYVGTAYGNWPIDRRIEGFLRHRGLARIADHGDTMAVLVRRVMSYMRIFGPRSGAGTEKIGIETD
jgi:hypothetical protein